MKDKPIRMKDEVQVTDEVVVVGYEQEEKPQRRMCHKPQHRKTEKSIW